MTRLRFTPAERERTWVPTPKKIPVEPPVPAYTAAKQYDDLPLTSWMD